jgi:4-hydroxyproline epimerase
MEPDFTIQFVSVVDSHTGGEPTRTVVAGGPELPGLTMAQCRDLLRLKHDQFRSAVVNEPRGSDVMVGALLLPSTDPRCVAGVVFFNNIGFLNMCGHGTIGVAVTLAHLGRIQQGSYLIETAVGLVGFEYHGANRVTIENVASYRHLKGITVDVEGHGKVTGDVAWGGNWFFLVNDHGHDLSLKRVNQLTDFTQRIRQALERAGITGEHGAVIDHIDLFGPPSNSGADSRNFVLCPGGAYDRSPCGTGTSAKLACLAADGKLKPGQLWRQESIVGSVFEGSFRWLDEGKQTITPRITGTAYVNADSTLIIHPHDPFAWGIGPAQ